MYQVGPLGSAMFVVNKKFLLRPNNPYLDVQPFYEDKNMGNLQRWGNMHSPTIDYTGRTSNVYTFSTYLNYTNQGVLLDVFYFNTVVGVPVNGKGVTITTTCYTMPKVGSGFGYPVGNNLGYADPPYPMWTSDYWTRSIASVVNRGDGGDDQVSMLFPAYNLDLQKDGFRIVKMEANSDTSSLMDMSDYYSKTDLGYYYPTMAVIKDGSQVVGYSYGGPNTRFSVGLTKISKTNAISCINNEGTYDTDPYNANDGECTSYKSFCSPTIHC